MKKPRVLVTISLSFSIRYLYRTGMLQGMKNFCAPVIALAWNEEGLIQELKDDGFEVHLIPSATYSTAYEKIYKMLSAYFLPFPNTKPFAKNTSAIL